MGWRGDVEAVEVVIFGHLRSSKKYGAFQSHGGYPQFAGWLRVEHAIKMDDLGVPLF